VSELDRGHQAKVQGEPMPAIRRVTAEFTVEMAPGEMLALSGFRWSSPGPGSPGGDGKPAPASDAEQPKAAGDEKQILLLVAPRLASHKEPERTNEQRESK
jgi:hypothetical protein